MRKRFIAGNWKMFNGPKETKLFFEIFTKKYLADSGTQQAVGAGKIETALFPPFVSLDAAIKNLSGAKISIGAQNCYFEKNGAFTGEISLPMIEETGATHVLIGHSERRHVFGERDELLHKKVRAALEAGLTPVFCVGELLEEREAGKTFDVIKRQTQAGLAEIDSGAVGYKVIIAYEPVWAIGTGKTARTEDAQEVCAYIRKLVGEQFGGEAAQNVRVLYGGSVKPENTKELMAQPDIDGVLVGGASLKPDSFMEIVKASL